MEITHHYPKYKKYLQYLQLRDILSGPQERVRNSLRVRAISVRAINILLYLILTPLEKRTESRVADIILIFPI